ncbi:MAG: ABC transporter ATP-binding protein [Deltaproteobacteria bacterium]|nr:ABC transporter ATP-binding protein [Candidatus Bathyarchaeota archaeon]RJS90291.1 MAG: ABC transporter ATP-binding protein [Candidatus Bathyarchaeota archaeon]RLA85771.1 MAG: ABC transporter ATP-binding protein [Deltaproteobacteria bacterium]
MNEQLIEIHDLYVNYKIYEGILKVLNGVEFRVGVKEKVGLIGESGCGKTTTMRSVMRILADNAIVPKGSILYKGRDILKMSEEEIQRIRRESISMIFQDPTAALNPVFTVGDQLMDVIKYSTKENLTKEEMKERAIKVLKEVALPDPERILKNYPIMLSGGMRQRICIAMALVSANELLIADEPGTNLDVTIQDQILRLIGRLVEERGTSIILISHALGTVKGLVDRVYVMYAGNMVEVAPTKELFSEPIHPYTIGLFKTVPKLTGGGIPEAIKGRIPDYINPPQGCRFFPRCEHAMPICKKEKPSLKSVGGGHEVACFLYE